MSEHTPITIPPSQVRVFVAACLCPLLAYAETNSPANLPPGSVRVEQGVADVSPLRTSLRVIEPQLLLPATFGELYKVTGSDGTQRFARVAGAVTAVFPMSEYAQTRRGTLPLIPAGTVFHLGSIKTFDQVAPHPAGAAQTGPHASRVMPTLHASTVSVVEPTMVVPISTRADGRVAPQPPHAAVASPGTSYSKGYSTANPPSSDPRDTIRWIKPGMLNDEGYRVKRVRELLDAAAQPRVRPQDRP